jgi:hypothetical protein
VAGKYGVATGQTDGERREGSQGPPAQGSQGLPAFGDVDTNADGCISKNEFDISTHQGQRREGPPVFEDVAGLSLADGGCAADQISPADFQAFTTTYLSGSEGPPAQGPPAFEDVDTNDDGCISEVEFDDFTLNMFQASSDSVFEYLAGLSSDDGECNENEISPADFEASFRVSGEDTNDVPTEASCTACGAGKYGVATGQTAETSCTACGAGTYRVETGGSAEASCTACGAGKYGVATGQTAEASCTVCGAGTYTGWEGATACTRCSSTGSLESSDCTILGPSPPVRVLVYGYATGLTPEDHLCTCIVCVRVRVCRCMNACIQEHVCVYFLGGV